jgi:hypothetical protein
MRASFAAHLVKIIIRFVVVDSLLSRQNITQTGKRKIFFVGGKGGGGKGGTGRATSVPVRLDKPKPKTEYTI